MLQCIVEIDSTRLIEIHIRLMPLNACTAHKHCEKQKF